MSPNPDHVSHGRPSPRTLEEAIEETSKYLVYLEGKAQHEFVSLLLRNQISILEALRGMQVIQREPR